MPHRLLWGVRESKGNSIIQLWIQSATVAICQKKWTYFGNSCQSVMNVKNHSWAGFENCSMGGNLYLILWVHQNHITGKKIICPMVEIPIIVWLNWQNKTAFKRKKQPVFLPVDKCYFQKCYSIRKACLYKKQQSRHLWLLMVLKISGG